jgi:1,2-diacylglycerol 3-beta-galactosyltransferase
MQRILLMMSDTGGGHRASAQALKAGYEELYPGRFQIDIVDVITDYLPYPLNQIPKTYPFLSNDAPWMWKLLYGSQDPLSFGNGLMVTGSWLAQNGVRRLFTEKRPDLIVSVHPLFQLVSKWVMDKMQWRAPFVTVVTDLTTGHPRWFDPSVDACYVPSQITYDLARRAGLRPDQLFLFGLPIRPAFARALRTKPDLRRSLRMDVALPAVLLIGGGEGVGPVEEIAAQLARQLSAGGSAAGQIVVICGRNKALQERLQARTWPIPVTVNGFVDNMPDWMAASDCVVTKAGPGTIAEALISGLPIVLSGFIPGQEEGNVPFVVENGVGEYSKNPSEIAAIVARWFGTGRDDLPIMAARARELGHPQATFDIVRSTINLLEAYPHKSIG